jgi:hypothetical protein
MILEIACALRRKLRAESGIDQNRALLLQLVRLLSGIFGRIFRFHSWFAQVLISGPDYSRVPARFVNNLEPNAVFASARL